MKKGFTLIELIAVIAILGILAVITVPIINNTINNNKNKLSDVQKEQIIKAAKDYYTEHTDELTDGACVNISDLLDYVSSDINNIKKTDDFNNSSVIVKRINDDCSDSTTCSVYEDHDSYEYKLQDRTC